MGEELEAMQMWASVWIASGMLPAHLVKPEQVLAVMFAARDLGLKPTAALKGLYVVKGKVGMEFQTMNGLCQARLPEYELQVVERTASICKLRARRSRSHEFTEMSFTIQDAAQAGLTTGDVWKKYPADMLYAKCGERLLRAIASDVLLGISYDGEEMAIITGKEQPTLSVENANATYQMDSTGLIDATILDATNFQEEEEK
jgi:hypothetical protein